MASAGFERDQINHGLNGVVLETPTNKRLWKLEPHQYITRMMDQLEMSEDDLAARILGHCIPFQRLSAKSGSTKVRYERFLKERAEMVAGMVTELGQLPS